MKLPLPIAINLSIHWCSYSGREMLNPVLCLIAPK